MLIDDCGKFIAKTFPRYAIIMTNGTILRTSFEEKIILKLVPLIGSIAKGVEIHECFTKFPWIFFRVTENVLVVLATKTQRDICQELLFSFFDHFAEELRKRYTAVPKTVKDLVKFNILSCCPSSRSRTNCMEYGKECHSLS